MTLEFQQTSIVANLLVGNFIGNLVYFFLVDYVGVVVSLELRDLLVRGVNPIINPHGLNSSLDEFLSVYGGGYLKNITSIVKDITGRTYYLSQMAPADEEHPSFFTDLLEAAESIGFGVSAYVNVFADSFYAADSRFETQQGNGKGLEVFVCPNKPEFHRHMVTVVKEVAKFKVPRLFLGNLGYARKDCCVCEDCRAEFSNYLGLRYSFKGPDSLEVEQYQKWVFWRLMKINDIVQRLIEAAKDVNSDIDVIPIFPVDPELGFFRNFKEGFGIDIQTIARAANHIALEINPYTPILPNPDSSEFNKFVDNLCLISDLRSDGVEFSMIHGVIENEEDYSHAKALAEAVGIKQFYTQITYPPGFRTLREERLGLR